MTFPALPERRTVLGIVVGFFLLTGAIYWHSLGNGFVRWDDGMLITENPAVRVISPASLKAVFTHYDPELYIPLTFMSYQLDFKLGGQDPFMFHFTNYILHTLNALLVAWLFYALTGGRKGVALLAGLLFAVHPLHTEAVAWASARKDVLSAFFFLLSFLAWLSYRSSSEKRTYWSSVVLFLLGLLSKVMVVTLPVLFLLLDLRDRRKDWKQMLLEKWPFFALSFIFGVIALFGKQELFAMTSSSTKLLLALKSMVFSMQLFFWPHPLSVLYPYGGSVSLLSLPFLGPIVLLLLLTLAALWTLRWTRDIAFGWFFFIITIIPTLTNLAKGLEVYLGSDRYVYLPSIGLLWIVLLLGMALFDTLFPVSRGQVRRYAVGIIALLFLLPLSLKAYAQSSVWKDTRSLFSHVLSLYPSSYVAHNNLGNVLRREGKLDEAVAEFREGLTSASDVRTLSNLGAVLRKQGKVQEALETYRSALAINSTSGEALTGMGLVYAQTGQIEKALEMYGEAIAVRPYYAQSYVNRGSLLLDRGQVEDAVRDFRSAVRLDPLLPEAQYDLGVALQRQGEAAMAIAAYEAARNVEPEFTAARLNLGALYYQEQRPAEARREFRAILSFDPDNAAALSALRQMDAAAN
ncbi:MAG: tetratricopeptide repeat protein [Candidatus Peribacteraceae bacterium]|jgi:tetratricopeptide (TPR) repeat protein